MSGIVKHDILKMVTQRRNLRNPAQITNDMKNFINLFESTVSGSDEIIYHLCQSVFTHTQTKH